MGAGTVWYGRKVNFFTVPLVGSWGQGHTIKAALQGKLNTVSEEMDDNDVIKVFNEIHDGDKSSSRRSSKTPQTSFIFSLKNRVGGLARALRIFQVGKLFLFFCAAFETACQMTIRNLGEWHQCSPHRVEALQEEQLGVRDLCKPRVRFRLVTSV